jgi:hypothetical protein
MQAPRHRSSHAQHADAPSAKPVPAGLGVYSEDDDAATQMAAAPFREARWIVQVAPLDRRIMSTEQVLSEIQWGCRIHDGTLVWRGGMDDWSPVAAIEELAVLTGPSEAAVRNALRARSSRAPSRLHLASWAIAVLAISLTTEVLRRVGAFEAGIGRPRSVGSIIAGTAQRVIAQR